MTPAYDLRLRPHKVASACLPFELGPYVTVHQQPVAEEGAAVVCKVLTSRAEYGQLELTNGRQARLVPGDVIVGVLGNRAALRGFYGRVPTQIAKGDVLHLLNQGGVIGVAEGNHAGLGAPIQLEVIGTPIRNGRGLRLSEFALPDRGDLSSVDVPPVLMLVGTCMDSGKTTAASVMTRYLRQRGVVVHAGKVTGVAAIKDLLLFLDNGASRAISFLDCGLPSTCFHDDAVDMARSLLGHLSEERPDCIILEMGDGLMGSYGVDEILGDPSFNQHITGAIVAANTVIGGVSACRMLMDWGVDVRVVTGPATDNRAGSEKFEERDIPAANTFLDPQKLCRLATAGLVDEPAGERT